jgi:hypothetical protein
MQQDLSVAAEFQSYTQSMFSTRAPNCDAR